MDILQIATIETRHRGNSTSQPVKKKTTLKVKITMKFEILKCTNGQLYFNIKGANGEKIAQSEGYFRKESANDIITTIKKDIAMAVVVDNA